MVIIKKISETDVYYTYNTRGYMLYYKNQPIGGAGISKYAKGCRSNLSLFKELGEATKRDLLNGRANNFMWEAINAIDSQTGGGER